MNPFFSFRPCTILLFVLTIGISAPACGPKPNHAEALDTPPVCPLLAQAGAREEPVPVDRMLETAESHVGEKITVTGNFMGWQGGCEGGPPVSRSDWMLISGGKCVYVSGPPPGGFSPAPGSPDIGKPVILHAEIRKTGDGRIFLGR